MPSIKRAVKSTEKKTGFEAYDGPEPLKRAVYRTKVKQINFKEFASGSQGFVILLELEAAKGDPKGHKQFDGFPLWTNLVLGDKEAMLARESNLYAAFGAKDEPAIVFEEGALTGGVKVTSIGGKKNLIDTVVNADIKPVMYEGNLRPEVDGIYKFKEDGIKPAFPSASEQAETEDDEDDSEYEAEETEEDEAEDEGPSQEEIDREAELKGMKIVPLRNEAKTLEIDTTGLKKDELIEAILDAEFGEDEDEDDQPMATADDEDEESEEEDEAEEDDEEEEEEEEEEDLDASAEDTRKAELATFNRSELKAILKSSNPAFKVFKTTTDDALRDAIIAAEYGSETPF
jgi:hypothetical protein